MNHLRRIPPDELPTVFDYALGERRAANEGELLNFGLIPIGGDFYDVAHVDGTPEPIWGVKVIEGPPEIRYGKLPEPIRARVRTDNRFFGEM